MSPHSVAVVKVRSTIVRPLYIKSKPCWIQYAKIYTHSMYPTGLLLSRKVIGCLS